MFPLIKAQESKDYWEASYAVGSILRHNKIIGHLFVARPKLLSVAWHRTARGDEIWKERYNYPDWGLTLLHQHFNNPALGSTTALNYTTTYYLRNRNAINQLNFKVGLGLGYNTRPFDLETNIRNVVMTTPFFISLHFKLLYTRHRLFKKWGFYTGLAYTHYSNGSVEQPNLGINTVFLNLGLMYDTVETKPIYTKRNYEKRPEEPLRVFINLNIGTHSSRGSQEVRNL